MNWKKWVGLLGTGLGMMIIPLTLFLFGRSGSVIHPEVAYADTYQLATSSWTVTNVVIGSTQMIQVDLPQMAGRTSIEIYNVDSSSPIWCGQSAALPSTVSLAACVINVSSCTGSYALRQIPPAPTTAIAGSNWWSLSLSNFSSNRGAYPVSVAMPVYCITSKVTGSTVTVTQSN